MSNKKGKISPAETFAKGVLKQARLEREWSIREGAYALGITHKNLEDIETSRDYGCHLDFRVLAEYRKVYGLNLNQLIDS